jgi:hypothetical protein
MGPLKPEAPTETHTDNRIQATPKMTAVAVRLTRSAMNPPPMISTAIAAFARINWRDTTEDI